ncbi:MAG: hypothetical protein IRY89_16550 [Pseudolabrys sp.]|nr:hypothetical protein [Pseudolabrys sp.]
MTFRSILSRAFASIGVTRNPASDQPFERLILLNWRGGLLAICAGMLLSFLVAGFWYPYWRVADMDFWIVYNAFLLNAHLPQEYFDHPGYLSILFLSGWLRALHWLGLVNVSSLTALPPVGHMADFTQAWTAATRAGRMLSLIYAMIFVTTFTYLLRALVRDWRIAALGGLFLAFSGGMAMEMRILRTELLASGLFFTALLMLLIVARRRSTSWRPAVVGLASALMTLAMLNKIQIIFLICAVPVILLPFGPAGASARGFWDATGRGFAALTAAAVLAAVSVYLAHDLLSFGLSTTSTSALNLPTLALSAKTYWAAIVIWFALGVSAYCLIWKIPALEAVAAALAALAGCMIGLLTLYACYNPTDVMVVFHPFEQMFIWAADSYPGLAKHSLGYDIRFVVDAMGHVVLRRTFFLESSPRPAMFLEWFIILAMVIAVRRREWPLVLQVAVLMLTDWGVDTLGMSRGLKQEYFLLTDPLAIIAAALLIAKLTDLQRHSWTYPVGVALIGAHLVVSQAEPVKHALKTGGPDVLCGLYQNAKRVEHLPVCKPP